MKQQHSQNLCSRPTKEYYTRKVNEKRRKKTKKQREQLDGTIQETSNTIIFEILTSRHNTFLFSLFF
jgi:hypothetical protein